jgi:hypothetical protein
MAPDCESDVGKYSLRSRSSAGAVSFLCGQTTMSMPIVFRPSHSCVAKRRGFRYCFMSRLIPVWLTKGYAILLVARAIIRKGGGGYER